MSLSLKSKQCRLFAFWISNRDRDWDSFLKCTAWTIFTSFSKAISRNLTIFNKPNWANLCTSFNAQYLVLK